MHKTLCYLSTDLSRYAYSRHHSCILTCGLQEDYFHLKTAYSNSQTDHGVNDILKYLEQLRPETVKVRSSNVHQAGCSERDDIPLHHTASFFPTVKISVQKIQIQHVLGSYPHYDTAFLQFLYQILLL